MSKEGNPLYAEIDRLKLAVEHWSERALAAELARDAHQESYRGAMTRLQDAERQGRDLRDAMRQWAQMIHQGYHYEHGETWETCPKIICRNAREILGGVKA